MVMPNRSYDDIMNVVGLNHVYVSMLVDTVAYLARRSQRRVEKLKIMKQDRHQIKVCEVTAIMTCR